MKSDDEAAGLTFQWRERESPHARLFFCLLLTTAGAVLFFMLFKVVYPQARHVSTAPQQVMLLDPAQSAARDIVNQARDENFLLLGTTSDPSQVGLVGDELMPVFKPSFAGFTMKLVDLPGVRDSHSLPRVFIAAETPLPPVATVKKAHLENAPTRTAGRVLRVVLHGDLSARGLAGPGEVNSGLAAGVGMLPRYRVSVSAAGQVTFALPLEDVADPKQARAWQDGVAGLRFKPGRRLEPQWGEVSFKWEEKTR